MSRSHLITIALGSLLAAGCVTSEPKTLASGGTPISASSGDDTASPSNPDGDTGMVGGEGAPIIENVEASWAEDQNGGWYIEASLTYSDEEDDVKENGMVGVTIVIDDDTYAQEWFSIDGYDAIHEDESNEVRFNPQPPDITDPTGVSVEMKVQLKDAATNRSNEYSVTLN